MIPRIKTLAVMKDYCLALLPVDAVREYVDGHKNTKYAQVMDFIYKAVSVKKQRNTESSFCWMKRITSVEHSMLQLEMAEAMSKNALYNENENIDEANNIPPSSIGIHGVRTNFYIQITI